PPESLVKDYKGGSVAAAGEAFDPSPANLAARTRVVERDGLNGALLPKKNRGGTVSLVLTPHYRNDESLKGPAAAAGTLPALMRTEPAALAANRLSRALAPYPPTDVRYVPTPEENEKRLEGLTLAQVIALYEQQLGAASGELAVVGDFDPEPTLDQVREVLKGWKSSVPVRRIARAAPADFKGARAEILTPDKANA